MFGGVNNFYKKQFAQPKKEKRSFFGMIKDLIKDFKKSAEEFSSYDDDMPNISIEEEIIESYIVVDVDDDLTHHNKN